VNEVIDEKPGMQELLVVIKFITPLEFAHRLTMVFLHISYVIALQISKTPDSLLLL